VIYPLAARWFLEGRLSVDQGRVRLDGGASLQSSLCVPCLPR